MWEILEGGKGEGKCCINLKKNEECLNSFSIATAQKSHTSCVREEVLLSAPSPEKSVVVGKSRTQEPEKTSDPQPRNRKLEMNACRR